MKEHEFGVFSVPFVFVHVFGAIYLKIIPKNNNNNGVTKANSQVIFNGIFKHTLALIAVCFEKRLSNLINSISFRYEYV